MLRLIRSSSVVSGETYDIAKNKNYATFWYFEDTRFSLPSMAVQDGMYEDTRGTPICS
jgi:hypothetical protein